MKTLTQRVAEFSVTGTLKFEGETYDGKYVVRNWKVALRSNKTRRQFTFPMTTGDQFGEPTIVDALSCMVMDAGCYFNSNDFRDFCDEFGWEIDEDEEAKIKARKAYKACERAYNNLRRVFGSQDMKALLFETEPE